MYDVDYVMLAAVPHDPESARPIALRHALPTLYDDLAAETQEVFDVLAGIRARWGKVVEVRVRKDGHWHVWVPASMSERVKRMVSRYNAAVAGDAEAARQISLGVTIREMKIVRAIQELREGRYRAEAKRRAQDESVEDQR